MSSDMPMADNYDPSASEPTAAEPPKSNTRTILIVVGVALVGFVVGLAVLLWPTWEEYASREGNFGVELPGRPVAHVRQTEVTGLPDKMLFNTLELEYEDLFAVAYADVPATIEFKPEELLDQINIVNLAGIFNAKYQSLPRGSTTFRGYPGRNYSVFVPGHGAIAARVLLVKRRIYLLAVCGEEVTFDREDVKRFLDSFDFVDDPK